MFRRKAADLEIERERERDFESAAWREASGAHDKPMSFRGGIPHIAGGGGGGVNGMPGSRSRPSSSSATRHDEKMSRANGEASTKATPEDFRVEKVISKGSFGTVYLALLQSKPFAMKVVDLHDMNRYVMTCVWQT